MVIFRYSFYMSLLTGFLLNIICTDVEAVDREVMQGVNERNSISHSILQKRLHPDNSDLEKFEPKKKKRKTVFSNDQIRLQVPISPFVNNPLQFSDLPQDVLGIILLKIPPFCVQQLEILGNTLLNQKIYACEKVLCKSYIAQVIEKSQLLKNYYKTQLGGDEILKFLSNEESLETKLHTIFQSGANDHLFHRSICSLVSQAASIYIYEKCINVNKEISPILKIFLACLGNDHALDDLMSRYKKNCKLQKKFIEEFYDAGVQWVVKRKIQFLIDHHQIGDNQSKKEIERLIDERIRLGDLWAIQMKIGMYMPNWLDYNPALWGVDNTLRFGGFVKLDANDHDVSESELLSIQELLEQYVKYKCSWALKMKAFSVFTGCLGYKQNIAQAKLLCEEDASEWGEYVLYVCNEDFNPDVDRNKRVKKELEWLKKRAKECSAEWVIEARANRTANEDCRIKFLKEMVKMGNFYAVKLLVSQDNAFSFEKIHPFLIEFFPLVMEHIKRGTAEAIAVGDKIMSYHVFSSWQMDAQSNDHYDWTKRFIFQITGIKLLKELSLNARLPCRLKFDSASDA